ncbi:hypothetical protein OAC61_01395 [Gammaproteobacteria bacterium]|nr:hypothetical protein [Gammaproteobacteria bacterium]
MSKIKTYTGITALATSYTAFKTKDIAEGQQELIETTKAIEQSNVNQERLLENIEKINKEQASLQKQTNHKLDNLQKTANDQLEHNRRVDEKREFRQEIDDEQKSQLKSCKHLAHIIRNEVRKIDDIKLTKLEKYLKLKKLKEIIQFLTSDNFEEISDKDYLEHTKEDIENALKVIREELSQQDKKDLDIINDIEEVNENEIAHKLLKEIEERELITSEIRELNGNVDQKKSLSTIEYTNIKNKIKFLYKKIN